jgi:hypothetical protein
VKTIKKERKSIKNNKSSRALVSLDGHEINEALNSSSECEFAKRARSSSHIADNSERVGEFFQRKLIGERNEKKS